MARTRAFHRFHRFHRWTAHLRQRARNGAELRELNNLDPVVRVAD